MKARGIFILICVVYSFAICAQTNDYTSYLSKARECVEAGNCDAAQRNYNVYKDLSGGRDYSLEEAIVKCKEKSSIKNVKTDYVDLGLPSGTLWRDKNEDNGSFYTWNQAVQKFGNKLPTLEQIEELKSSCRWIKEGHDFKVIGPNGKCIILQAAGYRLNGNVAATDCGYYWSLTSTNKGAWNMVCLNTGGVLIIEGNKDLASPVRLVEF